MGMRSLLRQRDEVKKTTSSFSRTAYSEAKLGFYPTDEVLAGRLGAMFKFQAGVTTILEPCAGEGKALRAFLDHVKRTPQTQVSAYCVELDHARAQACREVLEVAAVIQDNFLNGVRISNNIFPLVWANPPYGESDIKGIRQEDQFLMTLTRYVKNGGYAVWIIPEACLNNAPHISHLLSMYEVCAMYKFDAEEFAKYHQYALILRKKPVKKLATPEEKDRFMTAVADAPLIPNEDDPDAPEFEVPTGDCPKLFSSREFHAENYIQDIRQITGLFAPLSTPAYHTLQIKEAPPVQLKDESLYMCLACGVSAGVIGQEEDRNKHLLKGIIADVETEKVSEKNDESGSVTVTVRSNKQVRLTIVVDRTEEGGKIKPAKVIPLN
jgi:hypothetical protein